MPPSPAAVPAGTTGWTTGRVTALVIGCVLALVSLGMLGTGGTVLWADRTHREGGYLTSDAFEFSTSGSALVTKSTDLGSGGVGWLYAPGLLDEVRFRVAPINSDATLFVGIGPSAAVDRYLQGVSHTLIADFWTDDVQAVGGGSPVSAPGSQDFWVASTRAPGPQTLDWSPISGSWTVVVMNADGHPGLDVTADLGATIPSLPWIGIGLLVGGAVFALGGTFLIVGAIRRRRTG